MTDGHTRTFIDVALAVTLAGALYGWAMSQGRLQSEVEHLRTDVDMLMQTVNDLNENFQGTRLEIARWMAAHEDATRRR